MEVSLPARQDYVPEQAEAARPLHALKQVCVMSFARCIYVLAIRLWLNLHESV